MDKRLVQLSHTISYALRHHPEQFGLSLDEEGWLPVQALLTALHTRASYHDVDIKDIAAIIEQSDKQRFEMHDGMIRAYYGHSIPQKVKHEPTIPPTILFHGTTPAAARRIKIEGLKPMRRQYVHLSAEESTARTVALRRTQQPVILRIPALQAYQQGIHFYSGNEAIWLADAIPPQFIQFPTT